MMWLWGHCRQSGRAHVDRSLHAAEAGEDDMFLELPALLQAEIAQELTKDALAKSDILSVLVSMW